MKKWTGQGSMFELLGWILGGGLCVILVLLVGTALAAGCIGLFFGGMVWVFEKVAGPFAPLPEEASWWWVVGGFILGWLFSGSLTVLKIRNPSKKDKALRRETKKLREIVAPCVQRGVVACYCCRSQADAMARMDQKKDEA